jgi:hypothetical protein
MLSYAIYKQKKSALGEGIPALIGCAFHDTFAKAAFTHIRENALALGVR